MRKVAFMLIACFLAFAGLRPVPEAEAKAAPSPRTSAESAALIDVTSGRILHSVQGDKPMRIASLTKVMTAIVAIENGKLTDLATVGKNAAGKEGSSIYLKLGQEMNLKDLLYGMMLRSGNDAATAIAEHVGGSVEGFAYLMNEKAKLIGMTNSSFKNPSGLDQEGHYSTANDMAKLTAYAMKNPVFQEIVKTKVKKTSNPNEAWDYSWLNKNKMLSIYEGADGVKTGYTKLAKRCLISSATRGGQQLAVVTLNDPDDWIDHTRLLDFGFVHYPLHKLVSKGESIDNSDFVAGADFSYPAELSEQGAFTRQAVMNDPKSIDYRLGTAGKIVFSMNGKPIGSVPLITKQSPPLSWTDRSPAFTSIAAETNSHWTDNWLYVLNTFTKVLFTGRAD